MTKLSRKKKQEIQETPEGPVWKTSLARYSAELNARRSDLTFHNVIEAPTGHLSLLVKYHGIEQLKAELILIVCDLLRFVKVGKKLDPDNPNDEKAIIQTVELIISEFPGFKLEDILLCFKNRKMGFYGKLYDVYDGACVIQDLMQYDKDKLAYLESGHRDIKAETFAREPSRVDEGIGTRLKEFINRESEK